MRILPFGLGPAALAVAFFVRVNCGFTGARDSAGRRAIRVGFVDFLSFAMVTGLAILLATHIAILYGLDIAGESGDAGFDNAVAMWVFPFTAALLAGILGTLQCNMSRQSVPQREQTEPPEHRSLRAA